MAPWIRKLDDGLARMEAAFLALALATMVLVVFGDFALRETMNRSLAWAKELAAYLMVWVGFLGASLAAHRRRHLVMSLSEKIFPPRVRKWTALASCLVTAGLCLVLSRLGYLYVQETRAMGERSLSLDLPIWIVQAVIPLAFALAGLRFLGTGIHVLLHGPVSLGDSGPAPLAPSAPLPSSPSSPSWKRQA